MLRIEKKPNDKYMSTFGEFHQYIDRTDWLLNENWISKEEKKNNSVLVFNVNISGIYAKKKLV